jgi:ABC-type transport system substrate-binding protein
MQQDFKQIGVNLKLQRAEGLVSDNAEDIKAGKYHMWHLHWGMGMPDPSELTSTFLQTGAPLNFAGYSNQQIDDLAAQGIAETDPATRADDYSEIERLVLEDAAMVFLGGGIVPTFRTARVQNYLFESIYWQHWDRYWLQA